MGKYKGLFWPAILGVKHMPKVKESEFYNVAGGFRRATINDKIAFFLQHPVWEGRPELFMKTGSPKEIYAMSGMSVHGLCNLIGQPAQAQSIVDGFNYVVEQKGLKKVHFISGLYAEDEVRRDPDKGKVQGILFQGEPGKPVAVLIAGGGFDGEASKDVLPAVRYLIGHQAEYGYTMDGFGMFGFSAGGLMTTAYAFSDYKDCCHKHNLPRPAAIFPIYGLHWELKVHEEDKGLAIFSRVGRDDPTGFAAVEKIIPDIRKALGQENVDIVMYDKLGHGFGLGIDTAAEGWLRDAVAFWEEHRKC